MRVPEAQVKAAEEAATRVLQEAEIVLEWKDCTVTENSFGIQASPCPPPSFSGSLLLYFVGPLEKHLRWVEEKALGYSIIPETHEPATMAYVSWPRIQKLSAATSIDAAELLGLAVAHEIGHLLFGAHNHANQGIMRASWKLRDLVNRGGELHFTRDQSQRLRAAAHARLRAMKLGHESP